jgi:hypothetical protein
VRDVALVEVRDEIDAAAREQRTDDVAIFWVHGRQAFRAGASHGKPQQKSFGLVVARVTTATRSAPKCASARPKNSWREALAACSIDRVFFASARCPLARRKSECRKPPQAATQKPRRGPLHPAADD